MYFRNVPTFFGYLFLPFSSLSRCLRSKYNKAAPILNKALHCTTYIYIAEVQHEKL